MRYLLLALFFTACAAPAKRPELREMPLPPAAFDAELSNYHYPRDVRFFEFTAQGQALRMAYVWSEPEAGVKANGETVLLLHGKNFSAAYWESTIRALLAQGYRVLAPDQIGFGKSSKPAAYQFSLAALAQNTRALLAHLNLDRVHVVGHSMGGMLATRFALQYPESTGKLVLVNPIGLEDWKRFVPYRSVEESYRAELRATPETIREYQRVNYFGGKWKDEYEPLVEVLAGWTRHPDYAKVAWNNALTADMIFTQPVLYEFADIRAPTLLLIGQRDHTAVGKAWASPAVAKKLGDYPKLGRATARAIPGAKLVEFPAAGHLPQVENFPAYRDALLNFLAR